MSHERPRTVNREACSAGPLFNHLKGIIDHVRRLEWLATKAMSFARWLVDWLGLSRLDDWVSGPLAHA